MTSDFQFMAPRWLLVCLVPLLSFVFFWRFSGSASAVPSAFRWVGDRPHVRLTSFLIIASIFAGISLARPQWGGEQQTTVFSGREVFFALDLSRSMLVDDVSPSRLERAKLLLLEILGEIKGDRVGLILFAGTAYVQCPLSADDEVLRDLLMEIKPEDLPEAGTNYANMLKTAMDGFGAGEGDRALVVLSDGESLDGEWESLAQTMGKQGIRAFGIGIGSRQGGVVPAPKGGIIKDSRGAVVVSKLESKTLESLADITKGKYFEASGWLDVQQIVSALNSGGDVSKEREEKGFRKAERYQWPLAVAVFLGCISLLRELPSSPSKIRLPRRFLGLFLIFVLGKTMLWAVEAQPDAQRDLAEWVGRMSAQRNLGAEAYGGMAKKTISWGKSPAKGESIPAGAIDDALAAVDRGEKMDSKAEDWPRLRSELEELKKKQQDQKKKQPDKDNKDKNQDKDKDSKEDQKGENPKDSKDGKDSKDSSKSSDNKNQSQQNQDKDKGQESKNSSQSQDQQSAQKNDQTAGNQGEDQQAKPQNQEMRQVGGNAVKESKGKDQKQEAMMASPLDYIRGQDSPAHLFQTLDGNKPAKGKTQEGKTW